MEQLWIRGGYWIFRIRLIFSQGIGHSIDAVTQKMIDFCEVLREEVSKIDIICGHSYGGKIGLRYTEMVEKKYIPKELWILDTYPGSYKYLKSPLDIVHIMDMVEKVPSPILKREDIVKLFIDKGFPKSLALGMTMILRGKGDHYAWDFDIKSLQKMYHEYLITSMFPSLSNPKTNIKFVLSKSNDRWTDSLLQELKNASQSSSGKTTLHQLDCGHFMHIENPNLLLNLMYDFIKMV